VTLWSNWGDWVCFALLAVPIALGLASAIYEAGRAQGRVETLTEYDIPH
jgi:hypothetical protein